jgi:hypothetical protein
LLETVPAAVTNDEMDAVLAWRLKPAEPVTVLVPTVALATAVSAPVTFDAEGRSLTLAVPAASVNALAALKVPRPLVVETETTTPATGVPVASVTVAVTVTGAALVTVVLDGVTTILAVPALPEAATTLSSAVCDASVPLVAVTMIVRLA